MKKQLHKWKLVARIAGPTIDFRPQQKIIRTAMKEADLGPLQTLIETLKPWLKGKLRIKPI